MRLQNDIERDSGQASLACRARRLLKPRSFGRFMVVGILNTIVGVITFPVLYALYGNKSTINLLLTVSSVLCAAFSYLTHRILTFESKGAYHVEIGKFGLLTLAIYLINLAVLNTVPMLTGVHPVVAQVATTFVLAAALMLLNYFGMNWFVFATMDEKMKGSKDA